MERFAFWFGDASGRARSRHPFLFWVGMYLFIVVIVALGLHYIPRPSGNGTTDITFSWAGSIGIAILVGFVGIGVVRLFEPR